MKRNSAIATTVAVTGVIVAGSLAGIAMVTATAETSSPPQPIIMVAQGQPDPVFEAAELPALNIETAAPTANPTPSNSPSEQPVPTPKTNMISAKEARAAVQLATEGSVTGVKKTKRSGASAFAVTVSRPDGSVVTGYVDASTGVVFDWVVNTPAPQPTAGMTDESSTKSDDHDNDEYDNDDHDNDEKEHGEDDEDHDEDHDDD
ncbi:MAG: hypothetical protein K0U42_06405 [Actinomycetia bacterium]|nr:hypothetical protein [Actinomycetes bacterium]